MAMRDRKPEDEARSDVTGAFLRAVVVLGLATLIALTVLVRPLPEPPLSDPSGTPSGSPSGQLDTDSSTPTQAVITEQGENPSEDEAVVTPSPSVTGLSTMGATATQASPSVLTSTPTLSPTVLPSPNPTSTPTATPPATLSPSAAAAQPTETSAPSSSPLAGRVEEHSFASEVTGRHESYRIYLPPGYEHDDRRYPVLYLLHGWPYDEAHWDDLGVDEAADAGVLEGVLPPFLIVLPGADAEGLYVTTSGGPGSFEEQLVNELMPHVDSSFRSLQTREARAVGGISRGGVWALEIAFRHPDAFGAVAAHSPALSANRAPSAYDPFTLLKEPGVEALRIYLSAGEADWARQATVELHHALESEGISSELAIHSGAHVDSQWQGHIDEYLRFYTAGW